MNIFFLGYDFKSSSEYHCDKHVVKMILEYAQLLSTAHRILDNTEGVYKITHKNHPCAIWTRETHSNYEYLLKLLEFVCKEYTYRYGKIHKVEASGILDILRSTPKNINYGSLTEPPKCMPDEYKVSDIVESYRNYYVSKISFCVWTNRDVPPWLYNRVKSERILFTENARYKVRNRLVEKFL